MRRIIEYKAVVEGYEISMNMKINRLLSEGWEIYGSPSLSKTEYGYVICQAMVKYEPVEVRSHQTRNSDFPEGMFTL